MAFFRATCLNCLWVEDSLVQFHVKGLLSVAFLHSSWGSSVFVGHKLYTNWLSLCKYVTYSKRLPALDGVHMQMKAQTVWLLLLYFRQHITVLSVQCTYEMTYYLPGYEMIMEWVRSPQIFHLGKACLMRYHRQMLAILYEILMEPSLCRRNLFWMPFGSLSLEIKTLTT